MVIQSIEDILHSEILVKIIIMVAIDSLKSYFALTSTKKNLCMLGTEPVVYEKANLYGLPFVTLGVYPHQKEFVRKCNESENQKHFSDMVYDFCSFCVKRVKLLK